MCQLTTDTHQDRTHRAMVDRVLSFLALETSTVRALHTVADDEQWSTLTERLHTIRTDARDTAATLADLSAER